MNDDIDPAKDNQQAPRHALASSDDAPITVYNLELEGAWVTTHKKDGKDDKRFCFANDPMLSPDVIIFVSDLKTIYIRSSPTKVCEVTTIKTMGGLRRLMSALKG